MRSTMTVDLGTGAVRVAPTHADVRSGYLGGRGYGARLLYDLVPPSVAPESADNVLILTTGPFNGTPWPAASRYHLTFLSPLTGCYGYANAGGKMGSYLAWAGLDALILVGRAERPVTVVIDGATARLEPAEDVWGRWTGETEERLRAAHGDSAIACIGPAGENGVRFASVMNDGGRAAARTGGGAVFGGKNLKAIVVKKQPVPTPPRAFVEEARAATRKVMDSPMLGGLRQYGTPFLTPIKNTVGDLPTKNHQLGQVPFIDRIDAEALQPYKTETKGCLGCPIRCGRVSVVPQGAYRCKTSGPEYETIDSLGPQCFCGDPEAIIYANMLCNELGLDTLSTGAAIAFAMECHERGLLDPDDVDLTWGNADSVIALIRKIAGREGLGALLADGTRRAARRLGGEAVRYAMEVKGLEIPSQEGRAVKGFGLAHATSNRGADHLYGLPTIDTAHLEEAGRKMLPHVMPDVMDPKDERYKPDLLVFSEHYCAVADSLGVCKFSTVETYPLYPEDLARGAAALGIEVSGDELLRIGERIVNLERLFNVRRGLSAADDRLPSRFTEEPLSVQHGASVTTSRIDDFDGMIGRYYELRGWDADGIPTRARLAVLGLDELS